MTVDMQQLCTLGNVMGESMTKKPPHVVAKYKVGYGELTDDLLEQWLNNFDSDYQLVSLDRAYSGVSTVWRLHDDYVYTARGET